MAREQKNETRQKELREQAMIMSSKKVIIFDLDGTLTESKTGMDEEMSSLLCALLSKKTVAVMGGGSYAQFKIQFLDCLKCSEDDLKKLFILSVSGGSMYRRENGAWKLVYENNFTEREKKAIRAAFENAFKEINYIAPNEAYGEVVEDRTSQMTFSALGQKAPLDKKEDWNKNSDIRFALKAALEKHLGGFTVRIAGLTSIDITKKGIDKAYGVKRLSEFLSVPKESMIYVGDALYESGNDYEVKKAGIAVFQVESVEETKSIIRLLTSLDE